MRPAGLAVVVGSGLVPVQSYAWRSMATYLVFFLLGADLSVPLRRQADQLGRWPASVAAALLGGAVAAAWVHVREHALHEVPGVRLGVSLLAVGAGVALAVTLSRSPLVVAGRALRAVGAGWLFALPQGRRPVRSAGPLSLEHTGAVASRSGGTGPIGRSGE